MTTTLSPADQATMVDAGFDAATVAAMVYCECGSGLAALYQTREGAVCGDCWEQGHYM